MLLCTMQRSTMASLVKSIEIKTCSGDGHCVAQNKRIALDKDANATGSEGQDLVKVNGDALTLTYGGASVGGPRVYLIEGDANENYLFMLKNKSFAFDVELSSLRCGFNAALYHVGMDKNSGEAEMGTKYCDAQAVDGTFCSEMDIMEANTVAQQYTTHACADACASFSSESGCKGTGSPSSVCDQSGCGLNPFRYGPGTTYNDEFNNEDWYGPGSKYALDSTRKFTVVTQFEVDSSNELVDITRFYVQNDTRIDLPSLYVLPPTDGQHMGAFTNPSITKDFCADIYDRWNGNADYAPLNQMGNNLENGMVLAMSVWYAQETYTNGKPQGSQTGMSWLDGTNNWGKFIKAGPCDETTTDQGGTFEATFSNIRIGDIGSTVPNLPPAPSPAPAPTPTPTPTPAPSPS